MRLRSVGIASLLKLVLAAIKDEKCLLSAAPCTHEPWNRPQIGQLSVTKDISRLVNRFVSFRLHTIGLETMNGKFVATHDFFIDVLIPQGFSFPS